MVLLSLSAILISSLLVSISNGACGDELNGTVLIGCSNTLDTIQPEPLTIICLSSCSTCNISCNSEEVCDGATIYSAADTTNINFNANASGSSSEINIGNTGEWPLSCSLSDYMVDNAILNMDCNSLESCQDSSVETANNTNVNIVCNNNLFCNGLSVSCDVGTVDCQTDCINVQIDCMPWTPDPTETNANTTAEPADPITNTNTTMEPADPTQTNANTTMEPADPVVPIANMTTEIPDPTETEVNVTTPIPADPVEPIANETTTEIPEPFVHILAPNPNRCGSNFDMNAVSVYNNCSEIIEPSSNDPRPLYIICTNECSECNINCNNEQDCKEAYIISGAADTTINFYGIQSGSKTGIYIGNVYADWLALNSEATEMMACNNTEFDNTNYGSVSVNCFAEGGCLDSQMGFDGNFDSVTVSADGMVNNTQNTDRVKASILLANFFDNTTVFTLDCGTMNEHKNCEDVTLHCLDATCVCEGECLGYTQLQTLPQDILDAIPPTSKANNYAVYMVYLTLSILFIFN